VPGRGRYGGFGRVEGLNLFGDAENSYDIWFSISCPISVMEPFAHVLLSSAPVCLEIRIAILSP
jgi:hypothetical protein